MEQKKVADGLKFFSCVVAAVGAVFFFWYAPSMADKYAALSPGAESLKWPGLIGIWAVGLLCYLALWQFWKICTRIGNDDSFCKKNARSMQIIALLAFLAAILLLVSGVIRACLGFLELLHGVKLFFTIFIACGLGVLCLALARLIENAARLKEENDLTI